MNILKRLLVYVKPYWKALILTGMLMLGATFLQLLPPLVQRTIIDQVIGKSDLTHLWRWVGLLLGIYVVIQVITFGEQYVRHVLGARFIYDLRVRLYAHLQDLSLSFYERTSTGELMSRVTNDVNALEQFVTHGVALTAVDLLMLVGASVVLLVMDWRLALAVLIPVPFIVIGLRQFNRHVRPIYRQTRDRLGDINAKLQDNLSGIRVVQAFIQEKRELTAFEHTSKGYYDASVRAVKAWSTVFPFLRLLGLLGGVMVLGYGAMRVVSGQITLGTLIAFISYSAVFYNPLNRLTEIDNVLQQAIASGERIFELLDAGAEIKDEPGAIPLESTTGELVFDDVHFRYDRVPDGMDEESAEVLKHVSFHMAPGEVVALVGPSGAGKTSIARLLLRFYDPTHGRVVIDGHDLRELQLRSLRKHVAVVLQDTFLFNATVRENLSYGKPGASDDEIIAATKAAYAHEFILQLPKGYDTEIGERGVRLSGGQKQRLALARALLTDPRILILDEATSSVDAEAEYLIQRALEAVMVGRTSLVIAHRLSTIRNADKIIALEDGYIREVGSHEELLARGGLYSNLYRRQLELSAEHEKA